MSVPKCTSWRGHKFEGRYSLGSPTLRKADSGRASEVVPIIEASKPKTYERDICIRCGVTVEKGAQP